MILERFTIGPPELIRKLNQIVDQINLLSNMTGDEYVHKIYTPAGLGFSLNLDKLIRKLPKSSSSTVSMTFTKMKVIRTPTARIVNEDTPETYYEVAPVTLTAVWELGTTYAVGDECLYTDASSEVHLIKCKVAHKAGADKWAAGTYTLGQRAHTTTGNNKTYKVKVASTTWPPQWAADWDEDDDEPFVGNAWQTYWEESTIAAYPASLPDDVYYLSPVLEKDDYCWCWYDSGDSKHYIVEPDLIPTKIWSEAGEYYYGSLEWDNVTHRIKAVYR